MDNFSCTTPEKGQPNNVWENFQPDFRESVLSEIQQKSQPLGGNKNTSDSPLITSDNALSTTDKNDNKLALGDIWNEITRDIREKPLLPGNNNTSDMVLGTPAASDNAIQNARDEVANKPLSESLKDRIAQGQSIKGSPEDPDYIYRGGPPAGPDTIYRGGPPAGPDRIYRGGPPANGPKGFPLDEGVSELPKRFPLDEGVSELPKRFPLDEGGYELPKKLPLDQGGYELPKRLPLDLGGYEIRKGLPLDQGGHELPKRLPLDKPWEEGTGENNIKQPLMKKVWHDANTDFYGFRENPTKLPLTDQWQFQIRPGTDRK